VRESVANVTGAKKSTRLKKLKKFGGVSFGGRARSSS